MARCKKHSNSVVLGKPVYVDSILVNFYYCPNCDGEIIEHETKPNFCGNCGAKIVRVGQRQPRA